ncbi:hypothetical protein Tco_0808602 [Tanacetum coccineum]
MSRNRDENKFCKEEPGDRSDPKKVIRVKSRRPVRSMKFDEKLLGAQTLDDVIVAGRSHLYIIWQVHSLNLLQRNVSEFGMLEKMNIEKPGLRIHDKTTMIVKFKRWFQRSVPPRDKTVQQTELELLISQSTYQC